MEGERASRLDDASPRSSRRASSERVAGYCHLLVPIRYLAHVNKATSLASSASPVSHARPILR